MSRPKRPKTYLILLITAVLGIGLLHAFTPGDKVFFHETYRRLSYFPIVVAALLYGVKGGVLVALFSSVAFIPHLHLFHKMDYNFYLGELTEIILYIAAGALVGTIAGRESRLRVKYQLLSEKLEKSYRRLHDETELLLEVEEQLRVSQKLSALGQLSASLAHEIKNPLGSIKGTAEIFLDEFPPGHAKREFAEILIKEVTRLNTTVEEVLCYSRNQQQSATLPAALEPLPPVLKRVITLLGNKMRKKQITLIEDIATQATNIQVDGNKMAQVFINLMLNAIEAVDQNGRISLTVRSSKNDLQVTVSDNGPGISPEDYDKIFTPFYSTREKGTGLGLAISAKIVESYGGQIKIESPRAGGTAFIVTLPRDPQLEETV